MRNWLYRMERKFGRFAITNLMLYIVTTMLFVVICDAVLGLGVSQYLYFDSGLVLQGQVWRLITFIFLPPASSIITILFALYFNYWIGSSLEQYWGTFQFNVYYLVGILGTIIAGVLSGAATNTYLNLSLFLAFAQLFPDQQVMLFFIIPIKIKYLAYLDWILFAISFIFGSWSTRAAIVMSLVNFFLFFGGDFIRKIRDWWKYKDSRKNFRNYYK